MTPDEQAERMQRLTKALIETIDRECRQPGLDRSDLEETHTIIGALGTAVGAIAHAAGNPEVFMGLVLKVAQMVTKDPPAAEPEG